MAETGPEPSASASALAAERGLGSWAQATYLPKKAVFSRRWEDARLYLFHGGVIVTGPKGFQAAYDWDSSSVLQSLRTVNGTVTDARYTLFDRSGDAVAIGRGIDSLFGRQRERLGIKSLVNGAPFVHEGNWGPFIQQSIASAQMPGALARIERGETLEFGAIRVGREGVSIKDRSAAWGDIGNIHAGNGLINFPDAHRHRQALSSVPAHEVVNLDLFFGLCRHLDN
ncbi:DUF6585 family protein [Embleya sp. NBC_00896]|uniref:DUF6585 family protein n=1 Tax=Embleya sp. NBC_00896 TaxID=2975961 RepID=UPI003863C5C7|nr:hypothetical protein OG928_25645 [Embleya sp. NBC_00896]